MDKGTYIVRVIAAVVDQQQLTLYKEDGQTIVIPQGDARLARIIKEITPVLASSMGAVAEVDISNEASPNPYQDYEKLFGKAIQFFRVDKSKLAGWLSKAAELVTEVLGEVTSPTPATVLPMALGQVPSKVEKMLQVTDEIIAHAKPSHHPEFNEEETGDSTIVAVMGNKVVANIEKLKPQITRAVKNSDAVGFSTFMARLAVIADTRHHSVEDLLTFLEKGDLPIANDGSIIIYKILRRGRVAGIYVDCHTGRVVQKVGSYIQMDPSLVDHNRAQECSNGLHVARRAYLGSFNGDVVVLAKVAPEDVIAVPLHDANKMRVCGYHILFELSNEAFQKLKQNQPFTDTDDARLLLGRAIAGDHLAPQEIVRITENAGGGVITTKCDHNVASQTKTISLPAEALAEASDTVLSPSVNPREIATQVAEIKEVTESRRQKALRLYDEYKTIQTEPGKTNALQTLVEFKKVTKLGWPALGLSESESKEIQGKLG